MLTCRKRPYYICKCSPKSTYKSYLTILLNYSIVTFLVLSSHIIGSPLLKSVIHVDEFFTWRTSLTGLIFYAIIVATPFVFYFVIYKIIGYYILYGIYKCFRDYYSYDTIEFYTGVTERVYYPKNVDLETAH